MTDDSELCRQLMEAREAVVRQIEVIQNPIRPRDVYPAGIAKLRDTLSEIDAALAQLNAKSAPE